MVSNLPPGVNPGLSPWSPTGEIVRYVLEGDGYTLNQLKAVQDWVLERQLRDGSGRDRRDRLRRHDQTIPGLARHPVDETVRRDLADGHRRDLCSPTPMSAAMSCRWDLSRTMFGRSATWARGATRSTRRVADHAYAIEVEKLEDIQDVVVTSYNNMPVYVKQIAKVVIGYQPRLGVVGRNGENDVVEGIVLMRKYDKSLADVRTRPGKDREAQQRQTSPQGNAHPDLQPADRAGSRDDAQRVAQPGRRYGPGDPDLVRLPGRRLVRGHRGVDDPAGSSVFGVSHVSPGKVGQPALDRRGRFRHHRRQLGDHRRKRVPAHHARRMPTARGR